MKGIEIQASLRVMGDTVDPTQISTALGRQPDVAHVKGAPRPRPGYAPYSTGLWSLVLKGDDLDTLLQQVLAFCMERESQIRQLVHQHHAVDVFVGIFSDDLNVGFDLEAPLIESFGRLGIGLSFDVYSGPDTVVGS